MEEPEPFVLVLHRKVYHRVDAHGHLLCFPGRHRRGFRKSELQAMQAGQRLCRNCAALESHKWETSETSETRRA